MSLTDCRSILARSDLPFVKGLLVMLLLVQSISLWHSAEYSFEHHEHEGHGCIVDIYLSQSNLDQPVSDSTLFTAAVYTVSFIAVYQAFIKRLDRQYFQSRAPPIA